VLSKMILILLVLTCIYVGVVFFRLLVEGAIILIKVVILLVVAVVTFLRERYGPEPDVAEVPEVESFDDDIIWV
jgi:hypothetical protein